MGSMRISTTPEGSRSLVSKPNATMFRAFLITVLRTPSRDVSCFRAVLVDNLTTKPMAMRSNHSSPSSPLAPPQVPAATLPAGKGCRQATGSSRAGSCNNGA